MLNSIAVLSLVFSSFLITKGYLLIFIVSICLFCLNAYSRGSIKFDIYVGFLFFVSFYTLLLWVREAYYSTPQSNYFISSLITSLSFLLLLMSVDLNSKNLKKMLFLFQISIVIQSFIIVLRFTGLFEVPIPFGEHETNYAVTSLQNREQLTAVSLGIQISIIYFLSYSLKDIYCSAAITVFTLPIAILTGSTLLFIIYFIVLLLFFLRGFKQSKNIKSILLVIVFLSGLLFLLFLYNNVNINSDFSSEANKIETLSVLYQLETEGLLKDKLVNSNSRVDLFLSSIKIISTDTYKLLFGTTREEFLLFSGGNSPHSILSEIISLSGITGMVLFSIFFLLFSISKNKSTSLLKIITFMILMLLTATINSGNMNIPFFGFIAFLLQVVNIQSVSIIPPDEPRLFIPKV